MKLYHLIDKTDGDICYVGITNMPLAERLRGHSRLGSADGYHKAAWCHVRDVDIILVEGQLGGL